MCSHTTLRINVSRRDHLPRVGLIVHMDDTSARSKHLQRDDIPTGSWCNVKTSRIYGDNPQFERSAYQSPLHLRGYRLWKSIRQMHLDFLQIPTVH